MPNSLQTEAVRKSGDVRNHSNALTITRWRCEAPRLPPIGGFHKAEPIITKWEKKGKVKRVGEFKTLLVFQKKKR
jgi:hypothetical protein